MRSLLWHSCGLPNQRIQRTAKSVTSFAITKVPPFFAAADAGVRVSLSAINLNRDNFSKGFCLDLQSKITALDPYLLPIRDHCYFNQPSEMRGYLFDIRDRNSKGKGLCRGK
jgi:hypothetical protein